MGISIPVGMGLTTVNGELVFKGTQTGDCGAVGGDGNNGPKSDDNAIGADGGNWTVAVIVA
jgi:hypothetical protein